MFLYLGPCNSLCVIKSGGVEMPMAILDILGDVSAAPAVRGVLSV